jgi:ABC-2 type transport system ATP-binding protein
MDEAEKLCDRVAVIDHGKVIALGSPRELISSLGGEHVVEFAFEGNGETVSGPGAAATDSGATPADGSGAAPASLAENGERIRAKLLPLPSVRSARAEADGFALTVGEPHVMIPALLQFADAERLPLSRLTTRQASLEDVFVTLTGRHLRDE